MEGGSTSTQLKLAAIAVIIRLVPHMYGMLAPVGWERDHDEHSRKT